jgi:molybdopterin converting factor small subunit
MEIETAPTLRALIDALGERFGDIFREFLLGEETCVFLVNGSGIVTTGGLNSPLQPGDKIEVLPFVDGG